MSLVSVVTAQPEASSKPRLPVTPRLRTPEKARPGSSSSARRGRNAAAQTALPASPQSNARSSSSGVLTSAAASGRMAQAKRWDFSVPRRPTGMPAASRPRRTTA